MGTLYLFSHSAYPRQPSCQGNFLYLKQTGNHSCQSCCSHHSCLELWTLRPPTPSQWHTARQHLCPHSHWIRQLPRRLLQRWFPQRLWHPSSCCRDQLLLHPRLFLRWFLLRPGLLHPGHCHSQQQGLIMSTQKAVSGTSMRQLPMQTRHSSTFSARSSMMTGAATTLAAPSCMAVTTC